MSEHSSLTGRAGFSRCIKIDFYRHVGVHSHLSVNELGEGSRPRRVGAAAGRLREQPCPDRPASRAPSSGATSNNVVLQTTTVNSFEREIATSNRRGLRINRSSRRANSGSETVAETAMISRSPPWYFSTVLAVMASGRSTSRAPRWALCGVTTPTLRAHARPSHECVAFL